MKTKVKVKVKTKTKVKTKVKVKVKVKVKTKVKVKVKTKVKVKSRTGQLVLAKWEQGMHVKVQPTDLCQQGNANHKIKDTSHPAVV